MTKLRDRVKEISTTTGTGDMLLGGADLGFQAFDDALDVGDVTYYTITQDSVGAWEVGQGRYSATGTLARDIVFSSSNSGALVDFASGTKSVFITYPAYTAVTVNQAVAFSIALGG